MVIFDRIFANFWKNFISGQSGAVSIHHIKCNINFKNGYSELLVLPSIISRIK
jgi:hypothetical protein